MNEKNPNTKFPKGFFTSIKPSKISHSKDSKDYDKPFEWSTNTLNGKSTVKIVSNTSNPALSLVSPPVPNADISI